MSECDIFNQSLMKDRTWGSNMPINKDTLKNQMVAR